MDAAIKLDVREILGSAPSPDKKRGNNKYPGIHFESRVKRNIFIALIISSIPDLIIAGIIAMINKNETAFIIAFFALKIVYLLVWIRNSVWNWILYQFGVKEAVISNAISSFKRNNYPEPDYYLDSAEAYFDQIANDEDLPLELRLHAAVQTGFMLYPTAYGHLQEKIRVTLATEKAIEKYRQTFDSSTT